MLSLCEAFSFTFMLTTEKKSTFSEADWILLTCYYRHSDALFQFPLVVLQEPVKMLLWGLFADLKINKTKKPKKPTHKQN